MALSGLLPIVGIALVVVIALTLWLWRSAAHSRHLTGLPRGRIVYEDTAGWTESRPLFAPCYGLSGKPDYMVQQGRHTIPVEVKPSRRASEPYEADILQLAAYCLLVQETTGQRPPHGLLHYAEHTFRIPYDARIERILLATLDDMREDLDAADVDPSHRDPMRCRFCGHRQICGHSLVD